jgi:hypothetical protein
MADPSDGRGRNLSIDEDLEPSGSASELSSRIAAPSGI